MKIYDTVQVESVQEMLDFGGSLAAQLVAGDVVGLCGELGAGKTHLVKGVAAGLGCSAEVNSPTFTIIQEYPAGRIPVYHIDCYRLESAQEARATGIEEFLPSSDGVTLVEWADKFPELLPANAWLITIRMSEENPTYRQIEVSRG